MRKSRSGYFPHFMYAEQRSGGRRLIHYAPVKGGDSECRPIFRGWVKWGDRVMPALDPHLAPTVENLRAWAVTALRRDFYIVNTRFGSLAFHRDDINAACTAHKLEDLLKNRIDAARIKL